MIYDQTTLWMVIVLLALGTFALRFSFLGLIGGRQLPDWLLRVLRYTPVAVLPGLMAPAIFLPVAEGAGPDPVRVIVAAFTVLMGVVTKNAIWAMLAGALVYVVLRMWLPL